MIAPIVMLLGVATLIAGGIASACAFEATDTPMVFEFALPLLTVWLAFSLLRLAVAMRHRADDAWVDPMVSLENAPKRIADGKIHQLSPDAEYYQEVKLPLNRSMLGKPALLRRRWVAVKITIGKDRHRYRISPRRRFTIP